MIDGDPVKFLKQYVGKFEENEERLSKVDRWYRDELAERDKPSMPKKATNEYRELRDRSSTPWLKMAVEGLFENLIVVGYRTGGATEDASAWGHWQANGFDRRQVAVHEGALKHGLAYVTVLPGEEPLTKAPMPVMRGVSAKRMVAFYADVAEDDWPEVAMSVKHLVDESGKPVRRFRLWDAEKVISVDVAGDGFDAARITNTVPHSAGVCPVVRYASSLDLEGVSRGEVEPFIGMASRINQATFDRLIVQRFGAWKVRYATGMAEPETDTERRAALALLEVGDILVNESTDAKFGTLPETPLDGFIKAKEADVRDFAAVTKTPPQELLGEMVNLSAEALAAAEAGRTRKVGMKKLMFGESHEQALRLAAAIAGDAAGAADTSAEVVWKDLESRSLAQTADALGKVAQMLQVPVEILWRKLPGFTQQDIDEAKAIIDEQGSVAGAMQRLFANTDPSLDLAA